MWVKRVGVIFERTALLGTQKFFILFKKIDFRERKEERQKHGRERHIDWFPLILTSTGDQRQPRYVPWLESEPETFWVYR